MFGKGYELSLHRVHDTVNIRENDDVLTLTVSADPMRIVAGLNKAQAKLTEVVNIENPEDDKIREAAVFFASVIFGSEQAGRLMEFYGNDPACVINVCGNYFRDRLGKKITKMQKKAKK